MGIDRLRTLSEPSGCQAIINGKVCGRSDNATIHRQKFNPKNKDRPYHEYQEQKES